MPLSGSAFGEAAGPPLDAATSIVTSATTSH